MKITVQQGEVKGEHRPDQENYPYRLTFDNGGKNVPGTTTDRVVIYLNFEVLADLTTVLAVLTGAQVTQLALQEGVEEAPDNFTENLECCKPFFGLGGR